MPTNNIRCSHRCQHRPTECSFVDGHRRAGRRLLIWLLLKLYLHGDWFIITAARNVQCKSSYLFIYCPCRAGRSIVCLKCQLSRPTARTAATSDLQNDITWKRLQSHSAQETRGPQRRVAFTLSSLPSPAVRHSGGGAGRGVSNTWK